MSRVMRERRVLRVRGGQARRSPDRLVVEEPLELRVSGHPVGVTMRTPGDDVELAIGYCITEGLVRHHDDIATVRACAGSGGEGEFNVLSVELRPGVPAPSRSLDRLHVTSSSCGVCGKSSIDEVRVRCAQVGADPLEIGIETLTAVPERVRAAQRVFERTGGLHAAALLDADGAVLCVREDVGRHNATDKAIGWAATQGMLPLSGTILFASGRCSFEIAQKAAVAGIPMVVAVSAPSSLAVDLGEELGMTIVGFLRGDGMNVYTRPDRVNLAEQEHGQAEAAAG
jgi:FdhD protein